MTSIIRKLIDWKQIPRTRIELHLHYEGAIRHKTLWQLAQHKGIKSEPFNGTYDEFVDYCLLKQPGTLSQLLAILGNISPAYRGDSRALERIAYEISEDEAKEGVLYFELRMSAQYGSNTVPNNEGLPVLPVDHPNAVSPKQVVESVLRGMKKAQADFGIHSSLILALIRGDTEYYEEVLQLAVMFRDQGVVGIDIAGSFENDQESYGETEAKIYQRARQLGIHRTVHAGEAGPASNVEYAMDKMCAQRIGHGYHVIQDKQIYQKCLSANLHFECCPYSSYFTGAIKPSDKNAIVQFAEDDANFSLNKDDPVAFGSTLDTEYQYLYALGLKEVHIVRANINAAKSAFLPQEVKIKLLRQLYAAYGFNP